MSPCCVGWDWQENEFPKFLSLFSFNFTLQPGVFCSIFSRKILLVSTYTAKNTAFLCRIYHELCYFSRTIPGKLISFAEFFVLFNVCARCYWRYSSEFTSLVIERRDRVREREKWREIESEKDEKNSERMLGKDKESSVRTPKKDEESSERMPEEAKEGKKWERVEENGKKAPTSATNWHESLWQYVNWIETENWKCGICIRKNALFLIHKSFYLNQLCTCDVCSSIHTHAPSFSCFLLHVPSIRSNWLHLSAATIRNEC